MTERKKTIVLGATVDHSLLYIEGMPQKLVKDGWDVHLVCSPGARLEEFDALPGVTVHRLPMVRRPAPLADVVALRSWIRLLSRIRPTVVSIGTPKASLLGLAAAAVTRVPSRIYILHGLRLESAHGIGRRILALLERLTQRFATQTFAVSTSLANKAVALSLVPATKISIVGKGTANGVDVMRFRPEDARSQESGVLLRAVDLREGIPVVGFVGRINRDKGLDDLQQALALLEHRNVSLQVLVVGEADDASGTATVARLVQGETVVHLTGFVPDAAPYYAVMDVLCLPSVREGFPTVVLEAAACEVPTITTNVTGAKDSVIDGVTGILVPVHAPVALADALEEMLTNVEGRKEMGRKARLWVHENFTSDLVQRAFLTAYNQAQERKTK